MYAVLNAAVRVAPPRAHQDLPAQIPAAARTTPPSRRIPVSRAVSQPPIRPVATTGAVLTLSAGLSENPINVVIAQQLSESSAAALSN